MWFFKTKCLLVLLWSRRESSFVKQTCQLLRFLQKIYDSQGHLTILRFKMISYDFEEKIKFPKSNHDIWRHISWNSFGKLFNLGQVHMHASCANNSTSRIAHVLTTGCRWTGPARLRLIMLIGVKLLSTVTDQNFMLINFAIDYIIGY